MERCLIDTAREAGQAIMEARGPPSLKKLCTHSIVIAIHARGAGPTNPLQSSRAPMVIMWLQCLTTA